MRARGRVSWPMLLAAAAALLAATTACRGASTQPEEVRVITADLDRFWIAYAARDELGDVRAFDSLYLAPASSGLREFDSTRIGGAAALAEAVSSHPAYYASLRRSTDQLAAQVPTLHTAMRRLRALYPEAMLPDIYFLIGGLNSAGTVGASGVLIGTEMFGRTSDSLLVGMSEWHRAVLLPIDRVPVTVVHELCHLQYRPTAEVTLLVRSLREGTCDFISELATGVRLQKAATVWGLAHERELWREFRRRMHGESIRGFLYDGERAEGRPADLGYFIGYRIAEAYYAKAADKRAAIRELFRHRDARNILKASGYDP